MRGKQLLDGLGGVGGGLIPACAGKTGPPHRDIPRGRAHPRVCGENTASREPCPSCAGSSPRVRGKHGAAADRLAAAGLIPACAGKTITSRLGRPGGWAHPRVCGENASSGPRGAGAGGSSPRVRGKPGHHDGLRATARLIPACAGKTRPLRGAFTVSGAHPRVCGENATSIPVSEWEAGSSPRVRGKRRCLSSRGTSAGLIPACAGKTRCRWRRWRPRSAHPRVCGENFARTPARESYSGSSPRVRGKPHAQRLRGLALGLIPACAGKTMSGAVAAAVMRAHPRVCGENNSGAGSGRRGRGSSPRVRGKRRTTTPESLRTRLIPACAGKTRKSSPASGTAEAHPRVCGENTDYFANGGVEYGSSPRVRGKRADGADRVARRGLIPACAGKTDGATCSSTPTPAHPRVCGENRPRARARVHGAGSSPRVRGKPPAVPGRRRERGLIPACAGKTGALPPGGPPLRAHPRVCGENVTITEPTVGPVGSSPRVRGKLRRVIGVLLPSGAHPRVCGENVPRCSCATSNWGSSPRVRGKLGSGLGAGAGLRLIPACAGKTTPSS